MYDVNGLDKVVVLVGLEIVKFDILLKSIVLHPGGHLDTCSPYTHCEVDIH